MAIDVERTARADRRAITRGEGGGRRRRRRWMIRGARERTVAAVRSVAAGAGDVVTIDRERAVVASRRAIARVDGFLRRKAMTTAAERFGSLRGRVGVDARRCEQADEQV